jgi:single-stranded DNA-specific DHH superfamily exonuclease
MKCMLTEKQMQEIRNALFESKRPLFFFHDDADGMASFLQFYKQVKIGKGVIVKSTPNVDHRFIATAKNYNPDVIFILDLAMVDQDFVDEVKTKIIWIDHHDLQDIKGVKYYNPKQNKKDDNTCISKLSYDIFKKNLWIAAAGTIGDWQLPDDIKKQLLKDLPHLFNEEITEPPQALFETKIGEIVKIISFVLKGPMKEVHQSIKILTRIENPDELLEGTSEQGRFLFKKFNSINKEYEQLLNQAEKGVNDDDKLLIFTYNDNKISLSGELSNELLYRHPDKIIIIARHNSGHMKTSFRSSKDIKVKPLLEKAIIGIDGRVGGHMNACGGLIRDSDWDLFIDNLRNQLK